MSLCKPIRPTFETFRHVIVHDVSYMRLIDALHEKPSQPGGQNFRTHTMPNAIVATMHSILPFFQSSRRLFRTTLFNWA